MMRMVPSTARLSAARPERAAASRPLPSVVVRSTTARQQVKLNPRLQETALVASTLQYSVTEGRKAPPSGDGFSTFCYKVGLAWSIFFPNKPKDMSPKDEVKKRLRMVLVADRCGMSPASLLEMKVSIIRALEDYVDIDCEESIDVAISNDPGIGTVYSVNIPVKRVKTEVRFADLLGEVPEGVTMEWSPDSYDSDPSSRFPMGC